MHRKGGTTGEGPEGILAPKIWVGDRQCVFLFPYIHTRSAFDNQLCLWWKHNLIGDSAAIAAAHIGGRCMLVLRKKLTAVRRMMAWVKVGFLRDHAMRPADWRP